MRREGREILGLDTTKMATGGSSAGGNLAAVMCQRAALRGHQWFKLQLLSVPVIDNRAKVLGPRNNPNPYPSWDENEHAPALPARKMMWYRHHYMPNDDVWPNYEASPIRWPGDWSTLPPACIVVGELDVLRSEGEAFGKRLRDAGVEADVTIMKGQPHPFIAMDGVLEAGSRAITLFCEALRRAMYPEE